MSQAVTVENVIAAFIETRDLIASQQKELEENQKELKALQVRREEFLRNKLAEVGADSFKTSAGTCFTSRKESVKVDDWDTFLAFVASEQRFEFLNKGVNKTAALEMMGDKRDQPLPPGVGYTAIASINIRRK